jgi:hypothetical protein
VIEDLREPNAMDSVRENLHFYESAYKIIPVLLIKAEVI